MHDLIIVAGGRATRLGGVDKTALVFDGRPLLIRAVDAGIDSGARNTVVVGYDGELALPGHVWRAFEDPRWGGPAAAIVAGLRRLGSPAQEDAAIDADAENDTNDLVAVLAADLLHPAEALATLLSRAEAVLADEPELAGAVAIDSAGHRQVLLGVFRTHPLVAATLAAGSAENLSVRSILGSLALAEILIDDELLADVDTAGDAARAGIIVPGDGAAGPEA